MANPEEGKYVVIEGHDGTGKSTQVEIIRKKLAGIGIESIEFHEPAGCGIADAIRTILKDSTLERDPITDLLLFSAARHEIWTRRALPALKMGKWAVASRNYYSTLAYQGQGDGLDKDLIDHMTILNTDDHYINPDVAVVLTLNNEKERARRIAKRGTLEKPDTFESKDEAFQVRVNDAYVKIAQEYNLPVIDAGQEFDEVTAEIWSHLEPYTK